MFQGSGCILYLLDTLQPCLQGIWFFLMSWKTFFSMQYIEEPKFFNQFVVCSSKVSYQSVSKTNFTNLLTSDNCEKSRPFKTLSTSFVLPVIAKIYAGEEVANYTFFYKQLEFLLSAWSCLLFLGKPDSKLFKVLLSFSREES